MMVKISSNIRQPTAHWAYSILNVFLAFNNEIVIILELITSIDPRNRPFKLDHPSTEVIIVLIDIILIYCKINQKVDEAKILLSFIRSNSSPT
jgi:hypothetical protein